MDPTRKIINKIYGKVISNDLDRGEYTDIYRLWNLDRSKKSHIDILERFIRKLEKYYRKNLFEYRVKNPEHIKIPESHIYNLSREIFNVALTLNDYQIMSDRAWVSFVTNARDLADDCFDYEINEENRNKLKVNTVYDMIEELQYRLNKDVDSYRGWRT